MSSPGCESFKSTTPEGLQARLLRILKAEIDEFWTPRAFNDMQVKWKSVDKVKDQNNLIE